MTTSASRLDVSSCGKFDLGMPFPTLPLSLSVGPVPLHASAECVSGICKLGKCRDFGEFEVGQNCAD